MTFEPLVTDRLLLRAPRAADLQSLIERRSDPRVAEYQNWEIPYPPERAELLLAQVTAMDGPEDESWWMLTIANRDDTKIYGDLALHMTNDMRTAEIGYSLSSANWGNGYAHEAAGALAAYLFGQPEVTRVWAMLHPENPASAIVLERIGMQFEGHTRLSYWVGEDNSDDWIYGMTRADWEAWRDRPTSPPDELRLVEVDATNERALARLRTHKTQERFVAPMLASYADALFPETVDGAQVVPLMRGVEADGAWVGFVMLAQSTDHHPEPYLWRLLIDRLHQRRGIGERVLDDVIAECKAAGDSALLTSWVEGRGSPAQFYLRYGFEATGKIVDGETEARIEF